MRVDPTLHVPADSLALQERDQQRWTRHLLRPFLRVVAMAIVHVSLFVKRLLPVPLGSERALNWIGPRFVRRFASPEALAYVLRHFVIESNLINFVARNCGADDVHEVTLRPTSADGLADDGGLNAVVRHDANIFNLIIDLGASATADVVTTRPLEALDFSMLTIPALDLQPEVRRWIRLDLESTLHITVAALALFMDGQTAERAVNSFQLDESMLACIAELTGDPVFRTWTPVKFPNWLGMSNNVGRDLHWHLIVNEYAHERLCRLRARRDGHPSAGVVADGDAGRNAGRDAAWDADRRPGTGRAHERRTTERRTTERRTTERRASERHTPDRRHGGRRAGDRSDLA